MPCTDFDRRTKERRSDPRHEALQAPNSEAADGRARRRARGRATAVRDPDRRHSQQGNAAFPIRIAQNEGSHPREPGGLRQAPFAGEGTRESGRTAFVADGSERDERVLLFIGSRTRAGGAPEYPVFARGGRCQRAHEDERSAQFLPRAVRLEPTGAATGSSTGGSSSDADDAELEKKAARLMKSMPAEEASAGAASGGAGSATGNPAMKAMLDQLKAINSTLASHGKMMREMGNASKGGNWSATITIDDGRTGSKSNESTTPKTDAEVEAESGSAGSAASGPAASGPAASGPAASGPAASGPAASGPAASGPAPAANSGASGPEKTVKPIIEGESGAAANSGASGASSSGASGAS